jgi:hypothetical protein
VLQNSDKRPFGSENEGGKSLEIRSQRAVSAIWQNKYSSHVRYFTQKLLVPELS